MTEINLIDDILAEREIRSVMSKYFRANDRLQLDELAQTYHPDAFDDHGTYKGDVEGLVAWIAERHKTIDQSMHLAGNSFIERDGDRAFVETYCTLFQHERMGGTSLATRKAVYRRLTFGLRYVDLFEKREGAWKIARRVVVWEWAHEDVGDLTMDPIWVTAKRSREDAVYSLREDTR